MHNISVWCIDLLVMIIEYCPLGRSGVGWWLVAVLVFCFPLLLASYFRKKQAARKMKKRPTAHLWHVMVYCVYLSIACEYNRIGLFSLVISLSHSGLGFSLVLID